MRVVRPAGIGPAVVLAVMGSAGLAGCFAGTGAKEATIESAPQAEGQDDPYPALSQPCDVARAEPFRGRLPDTETIAALRRATGASAVRIAPGPGTPMSMEGMVGRLTVTLDEEGRMLLFACE